MESQGKEHSLFLSQWKSNDRSEENAQCKAPGSYSWARLQSSSRWCSDWQSPSIIKVSRKSVNQVVLSGPESNIKHAQ